MSVLLTVPPPLAPTNVLPASKSGPEAPAEQGPGFAQLLRAAGVRATSLDSGHPRALAKDDAADDKWPGGDGQDPLAAADMMASWATPMAIGGLPTNADASNHAALGDSLSATASAATGVAPTAAVAAASGEKTAALPAAGAQAAIATAALRSDPNPVPAPTVATATNVPGSASTEAAPTATASGARDAPPPQLGSEPLAAAAGSATFTAPRVATAPPTDTPAPRRVGRDATRSDPALANAGIDTSSVATRLVPAGGSSATTPAQAGSPRGSVLQSPTLEPQHSAAGPAQHAEPALSASGTSPPAGDPAADRVLREASAARTEATPALSPASIAATEKSALREMPTILQAGDHVMASPAWQEDVTQKLAHFVSMRGTDAEIRLNPADLGPVGVTISYSDDQAKVLITAAQPATRDALEQALPHLKEMLAQQGITLGEATVRDQQKPMPQWAGATPRHGTAEGADRTANGLPQPAADAVTSAGRTPRLIDTFA